MREQREKEREEQVSRFVSYETKFCRKIGRVCVLNASMVRRVREGRLIDTATEKLSEKEKGEKQEWNPKGKRMKKV